MKKLSLALVFVTLLTFLVTGIGVGASGAPIDAFTEVSAPDEGDMVTSTTWNFYTAWGLTDPVGSWHIDDFTEARYNQNQAGMYLDNDNAVTILEFKDSDLEGVDAIGQIVFCDLYTISGDGFGMTEVTPSDFDRLTLVYSDDFENWMEAEYTVTYHNRPGTAMGSGGSQTYTVDLYWHLNLVTPVLAKYWALNTSESAGWDEAGHTPEFGIFMDWKHYYGVKAAAADDATTEEVTTEEVTTEEVTTEEVTTAEATADAITTDAITTDAVTTDAVTTDGSAEGVATTDETRDDVVVTDLVTNDFEDNNAPGNGVQNSPSTSDFAVLSAAVAALAAAGTVFCVKKRNR